tara:strand:+ start:4851 stop:5711 length:861 start_codon:yes stop_codon:yes gene_type:complete
MTILISGSSGFLGKNLIKKIESNNIKYFICSNRIKKRKNFIHINSTAKKTTIKKYKNKFKYIIHLATLYDNELDLDIDIYNANIIFGIKLFKFAEETNAKYFFNLSTVLSPNLNKYSFTKDVFLKHIYNFNKGKIKIINLNLDIMFGYKDGRFFDNFLYNLLILNKTIKLSKCNQFRNISPVDTIVNQIIFILKNINSIGSKSINLGSRYEIRLKEFIWVIISELKNINNDNYNRKLLFGSLPNRLNERKFDKFTCDKILMKKFQSKADFIDSLRQAVQIEIKNYL